jgi:hypothetical protein
MESNQENETLIDKYLSGTLSEAEEQLLEEKRKSPTFVEELAFHEDLQVVATKAGKLALKDRLRQIEVERQKPSRLKVSFRRKVAIAASILLVLAAGSLWYAQANYASKVIFAQQYSSPNFSGTRSSEANPTYQEAANAFYTDDYPRAIGLLKSDLGTVGMPEQASLLLAHAYLKNAQPEAALALLPQAQSTSSSQEAWQWVEVLALLQSGPKDQLVSKLTGIANSSKHPNQRTAQEMLKQIQSPWRLLTR